MPTFANQSICFKCAHLRPLPPDGQYTCNAYPLGIPDKFLGGLEDHIEPEPDDGGIQYELRGDLAEMIGRG